LICIFLRPWLFIINIINIKTIKPSILSVEYNVYFINIKIQSLSLSLTHTHVSAINRPSSDCTLESREAKLYNCYCHSGLRILSMTQQPLIGQGFLIIEASRSHSDTQHTRWDFSGRAIRPTQRPLPDNTQHSEEKNIHAADGIRTRSPRKWAAADPHLRKRGHRDLDFSGFLYADWRWLIESWNVCLYLGFIPLKYKLYGGYNRWFCSYIVYNAKGGTILLRHSFIQYSVWRQVQSLLQNDASI